MAVPLVLLMVVLTGCQAVGGVDVGKAMANGASIKSGESRQSMNINIEPAKEFATEKDLEMIELINSISLDIDQAKMKDAKTASIKGTLSMEGTKLPFHLSMNESQLVIDLDGAQKPLYISLDTLQDAQALPMVDTKALEKQLEEISPKLFSFVLKHLSNPKNISVTPVQESVNGEALSLSKLHLEVSGEEMLAMVKPFLTSISKDEQGLKELIGDLYDVFYPVLEAVNEVEGGGDETLNSIVPESKDEAVASLYAIIKVGLDSMLVNYDQELNNLLNETPEFKTVFGTETKLKLDFYLDSKLDIRKQNFELKVALPASEDLPVNSVTVSGDSEQWNIGGTVAVDEVDVSGGVMDLMKDDITPGQMLRNFDSNSLAYQLLKDEAGITSKSVVLFPDDEYAGAITVKNTTFVPLRYVSEELDAEVKWTKGSNQIVVIDDITGDEIVLTVGSKKATVAGKEVTMVESAYVGKDGKTYVPLRFVAESLGATVDKEQETGWIYIDRP
ncbi:copper amine oxidase N-terminal domain-containing protein [Paenibacillus polymyxa]|uniref:copper amine oxidase N-terminal domain-containing protein n=1 Tax=Paenibacillus TaxID=44249 RepID=UPI00201DFC1F|nr:MULTISPECIES: copper amine oxidase N-terminal domain-containing protein [Paenibacillus]MCL6662978.1 copper amine oxidase N-terminal domain-containing protein [Paenibacillus amylolyticus]WJM08239.1 copper amine oxidase N-terminal domain-containing protein [Paenibacillus sp. PK1-4R]